MRCLVVYDIPGDRVRGKIAECCLDYGLDRIQYSAFLGQLNRTHQEELMLKVAALLANEPGKIQLFVLCDRDWQQRLEVSVERSGEDADP